MTGVFVGADHSEEGVANMARVTQRDHEVKRRSWCSSSPARPFPAWMVSSTRHLDPATRTSVAGAPGSATSSAVVGEFTGGAVAADPHVITHAVGIPPGPAEQVLHAVRRVYAVTRGHHKIFSLHTPMISGGRTRQSAGIERSKWL
jgi:hypothetical protein